jgi:hypothetical protein
MKCVIATCRQFYNGERPLAPDDMLLQCELRSQGIDAETVPWEAADYPWEAADLVKIGSTWNYHLAWERYREWIQRVAASTQLLNPLAAVLWNMEKATYFDDLQRRGIPLIPTVFFRKGEEVNLASMSGACEWEKWVLKPSIAANSFGCIPVLRGDPASLQAGQAHLNAFLREQDMLLQPFLSSIEAGGETSHVFVDGTWAHAFGKVAFGPRVTGTLAYSGDCAVRPLAAEVDLAVWVMETVQALLGQRLLYARVDVVRDEAGQPQVMEIEMIEPILHLDYGDARGRLARAIIERCYVRAA